MILSLQELLKKQSGPEVIKEIERMRSQLKEKEANLKVIIIHNKF